jgi:hypothetical protein
MFAVPSPNFDNLLSKRFPSSDYLAASKQELQRVVSKQFVSRLRGLMSISPDMIHAIRTQCRRCGWEYLGAPDQQQDASEFYSFFYLVLGGQVIFKMATYVYRRVSFFLFIRQSVGTWVSFHCNSIDVSYYLRN